MVQSGLRASTKRLITIFPSRGSEWHILNHLHLSNREEFHGSKERKSERSRHFKREGVSQSLEFLGPCIP